MIPLKWSLRVDKPKAYDTHGTNLLSRLQKGTIPDSVLITLVMGRSSQSEFASADLSYAHPHFVLQGALVHPGDSLCKSRTLRP